MAKNIDLLKRRVVAEKLHTTGVILCHLNHELYRVTTIHSAGLGKKELAHVAKQHAAIENAQRELSRVAQRANATSPHSSAALDER